MLAPNTYRRSPFRLGAGSARQTTYCAAVVSLAALLVGVSLTDPRERVFESRIQVQGPRDGDPLGGPSTITGSVVASANPALDRWTRLRDQLVQAAVVKRLLRDSTESSLSVEPSPTVEMRGSPPPHGTVRDESARAEAFPGIVLRARAPREDQARTLAEAAAQELVRRLESPNQRDAVRRVHFARWELRERRHYERLALQQWESYLANGRPTAPPPSVPEQVVEQRISPSAAEQERRSALETPPPPSENPRWRQLQNDVQWLSEQLQFASTRLQSQHPEVRQLQLALVQRERELNATPRFLPPAGGDSETPEPEAPEPEAQEPEAPEPEAQEPEAQEPEAQEPEARDAFPAEAVDQDAAPALEGPASGGSFVVSSTSAAPGPGLPVTGTPDSGDMSEWTGGLSLESDQLPGDSRTEVDPGSRDSVPGELEILRSNYQQAAARREEAEQASEAAVEQWIVGTSGKAVWRMTLPEQSRRIVGHYPRGRLLLVLLAATSCGLVAAWLAGRSGGRETLRDAADVEAAIGLPVLAELSAAGSEGNDDSRRTPGPAARWLCRIAEGVIGCYLFGLLVLLTLDSPLAADLAGDPLAAVAELPLRLWQALQSGG